MITAEIQRRRAGILQFEKFLIVIRAVQARRVVENLGDAQTSQILRRHELSRHKRAPIIPVFHTRFHRGAPV